MRCASGVRLVSFIIGAIETVWASVIWFDPTGRLAMMLDLYQWREEFCFGLLVTALMLIYGSTIPCRIIRHWGLWLTPMICLPTAGLLFDNNIGGSFTIFLPFVAAISLVIYFMDSMGKPRETVDR